MRTAATFVMVAAMTGAGGGAGNRGAAAGPPPANTFMVGLIAALTAAPDDAAVDAALARRPTAVVVKPSASGWLVTFPAIDARELLGAWHWTDMFAVSGDVHQTSFDARRSLGPIAPNRIATANPTAGVWQVRVRLAARPAGALPALVAGASPAYDLQHYAAAINALEITRAPRPRTATLDRIRALAAPIDMAAVAAVLGRPDRDIGSGIYVLSYALDDGSSLRVGTADRLRVIYIRLEDIANLRGPDVVLYQAP